ncbi:MAG: hypothetical protein Q4B85_13340 [Lachnospiraceae bacterium]|nr:hypothetical protein [Lachnospiraceae bacterium]
MKVHKINYNRLMGLFSFLYIAATVAGVYLNNIYFVKHLGTGLSPISILVDAIPLMAVLPVLLACLGVLKVDVRLPFMFFSLILVSFGLLQILFLVSSMGSDLSVYYIINIISVLLHMAAAVVLVLVMIGKAEDNVGVTCAWGALAITLMLFLTSLNIYDRESIIYVSLFPQLASCFSALLLNCMFFSMRREEQ